MKKKAMKAQERPAIQVPPELEKALAGRPDARESFDGLAPSHQRAYVDWILEARKAETRARRAQQALEMLAGGGKWP